MREHGTHSPGNGGCLSTSRYHGVRLQLCQLFASKTNCIDHYCTPRVYTLNPVPTNRTMLQEVGRPEGREALSIELVDAFEKERSLVLSIPAGSRTLREVGRQMHAERRAKEKKNNKFTADGTLVDQVKTENPEQHKPLTPVAY